MWVGGCLGRWGRRGKPKWPSLVGQMEGLERGQFRGLSDRQGCGPEIGGGVGTGSEGEG